MKKELMSLKTFMMKDKFNLIVFCLSFLVLIIGTIVFNFIISLIVFILINLIWLVPYFKWREKLEERNKIRNSKKRESLSKNEALSEVDVMPKKKAKKAKKKKSLFKKILIIFFIFIILCFIAGGLFIGYIVMTAGKFDPNKLYSKEASTLLDSNVRYMLNLGLK